MQSNDITGLTDTLAGVPHRASDRRSEWRYHGRLAARQLDEVHIMIRADFDYRDSIVRQFPGTFSVAARYVRHIMVVAHHASGDAGAIGDGLVSAWQLQRSGG